MQKSVQPQTTNNSEDRDAAVQISEAVKNHRISKDMVSNPHRGWILSSFTADVS